MNASCVVGGRSQQRHAPTTGPEKLAAIKAALCMLREQGRQSISRAEVVQKASEGLECTPKVLLEFLSSQDDGTLLELAGLGLPLPHSREVRPRPRRVYDPAAVKQQYMHAIMCIGAFECTVARLADELHLAEFAVRSFLFQNRDVAGLVVDYDPPDLMFSRK